MNLIEKLKAIQGDRSQLTFAREIGIDQSVLSRLYSGDIGLGVKTARMLWQHVPELRDDIASFLLPSDMHDDNGEDNGEAA